MAVFEEEGGAFRYPSAARDYSFFHLQGKSNREGFFPFIWYNRANWSGFAARTG
jgi:hypothetical protein